MRHDIDFRAFLLAQRVFVEMVSVYTYARHVDHSHELGFDLLVQCSGMQIDASLV